MGDNVVDVCLPPSSDAAFVGTSQQIVQVTMHEEILQRETGHATQKESNLRTGQVCRIALPHGVE